MTLPDMPALYKFSSEELVKVIARRQPHSDTSSDDVLDFINKGCFAMIREMGYDLDTIKVDFLRKNGIPLWGSGRIPLLVKTGDQEFVLKPYDVHNPEEERRVLGHLQRKQADIAPEVYWIGDKGYAEEFFNTGKSLTDIAEEESVESAIRTGGEMHARLALLGVNYNHNHWVDEFYVGDGRKIVDFGTAQLYFLRGSSAKFDTQLKKMEKGVESVMQSDHMDRRYWADGPFFGIPFRFRMDLGTPVIEQALSAGKTPEERLNMLIGWYSVGVGIFQHFLTSDHPFDSEAAMKATIQNMPAFLGSFSTTYASHPT